MNQIVIFSDLDGTLLDEATYSCAAAEDALEQCRERGIPVIAATSKTFSETRIAVVETALDPRFIFENGGGICLGEDEIISLGRDYRKIREVFETLKTTFDVRGFGDMTPAEIAGLTGLSLAQAVLAAQRMFSEPFLAEGCDQDELRAAVADEGLTIQQGNRFLHLLDREQTKGAAVRKLKEVMGADAPGSVISIGVGDSPNDFSMLKEVDFPVFVGHPDMLDVSAGLPKELIVPRVTGPAGWAEGVLAVIGSLFRRTTVI